MIRAVLALAMLVVAAASAHASEGVACARSPKLVGACFIVRGSLTLADGTPGIRIWRIGTKRMLGVLDASRNPEGDSVTPSNVKELLTPFRAVIGNYDVCPLTRERQGWMQMVCIKGASNLHPGKSN
jgi:hypothetical protein